MAVRVFVSYSHDSPQHMERVLALANRLREDGVDCIVDQYQQSPAEGWPRWTLRQLDKADYVLAVCSETYKRRMMGEEPVGKGRGAKWEGAIITQELYDAESTTKRFVPILPVPDDSSQVPVLLRSAQFYSPFAADGSLDSAGYEELYRLLTDQPAVSRPELGAVKPMPRLNPVADFGSDPRQEGRAPTAASDPLPGGNAAQPPRPQWKKWLLIGVLAAAGITAGILVVGRGGGVEGPGGPGGVGFEYSYFGELPYALFHSIPANEEDLYWLRLTVRNDSDRQLSVRVTCQADLDEESKRWALCAGQEQRQAGKVASYTVDPGELKVRTLNPRLRVLLGDNFSQPQTLKIEWTVFENRGLRSEDMVHEGGRAEEKVLDRETVQINVTPKDRYYFRLPGTVIAFDGEKSSGPEVDREFLMASLAAWTKIDPGSTEALTVTTESDSLAVLIRRLYEGFLQGEPGLRLTGSVPAFPPEPYEVIRPAKAIWAANPRTANPLEAALMIGALVQAKKPLFGKRLVLVWPGSGSGAAQSLFIAWRAGDGWQAIDLAAAGTSYSENLDRASIRLSALLDEEAAETLATKGVFLASDLSLAAVDFVQAARRYKIEGLP